MIDTAIGDVLPDGLINFDKRRKEFEVLAQIKLLQGAANAYQIEKQEHFVRWFESVLLLDERQAFELSVQIELQQPSHHHSSSSSTNDKFVNNNNNNYSSSVNSARENKYKKNKQSNGNYHHRKNDSIASTASSSSGSQVIDIKKKYSALHSRPHSVQAKCNIQINGCIFCAILKTIFQINGTWLLISLQCLNVMFVLIRYS